MQGAENDYKPKAKDTESKDAKNKSLGGIQRKIPENVQIHVQKIWRTEKQASKASKDSKNPKGLR
jgi:hypothetical protein